MLILAFHCFSGAHDTSACIVRDGRLVAAAEEERFTRIKHDGAFPYRAIEYCLSEAGVEFRDVDMIAFPDTPFRTGPDSAHAEGDVDFFERLHADGLISGKSLFHKKALDIWLATGMPAPNLGMHSEAREGFAGLRTLYGELPPVRYYDHHKSHAAAAYFTSGLESAAVVTIDGRGGNYATVAWHARGSELQRIAAEPYTNSIGIFYELCTEYLGLGALEAGKTMGLAPYGDPAEFRDRVATLVDTTDAAPYKYLRPPNADTLGFLQRQGDSPILEGPYADFAAAAQTALEQSVERTATAALSATGETALCLGGGVMYNCTSNGALLASRAASPIWVFPAAGDSGLSVGAALLCAAEQGELVRERLPHAYWGPQYSDEDCRRVLASTPGITFRASDTLASDVAGLLASGKIVGWFNGRMELGPRALGNRSILATPADVAVRDRVNRLKGRELWRPLAPMVLEERARDYFCIRQPSPFMLFAAQVRPEKRHLVPAIVHVDGSARPQTVAKNQNPAIYDLLSAFESRTGIPVLLNTSFNDASEPIVCTPGDAVRTFMMTGLDALVVGNFIVTRNA